MPFKFIKHSFPDLLKKLENLKNLFALSLLLFSFISHSPCYIVMKPKRGIFAFSACINISKMKQFI